MFRVKVKVRVRVKRRRKLGFVAYVSYKPRDLHKPKFSRFSTDFSYSMIISDEK